MRARRRTRALGLTLWLAAAFAALGPASPVVGCLGEDGCGECVRAVECVRECGGEVEQVGCCPCPEGTFDSIDCEPACEREIRCVETCGGAAVQSGCDACPEGSFDDAACSDPGCADASCCPAPYHVLTSEDRCVWSCGEGTEPDDASGECQCQPGLVETGEDGGGRRVCAAGVDA